VYNKDFKTIITGGFASAGGNLHNACEQCELERRQGERKSTTQKMTGETLNLRRAKPEALHGTATMQAPHATET
jgi:hypothetical protein